MAQSDTTVNQGGYTKAGTFWIALCTLALALLGTVVMEEHRITVIEDRQAEQQRQIEFVQKQYTTVAESLGRIEGSVNTLTTQLIGVSDGKPKR